MTNVNYSTYLERFASEQQITSKGPLCVVLVLTRMASKQKPPYTPQSFLTPKGGQVAGLGRQAVQTILADHGITRILAEEGGRTSRGSKCIDNLDENLRPVIITIPSAAGGGMAHAKNAGVEDRFDILEVDQFIATNIYEWSGFKQTERRVTFKELVVVYNRIVEETETDPSLLISIG